MSNFLDIIRSKPIVLVDFFAQWCGPCKMMTPVLEQVKAQLGDQVTILKIDVDKNQKLAQNHQIKGVPTFMLFKNGKQVWRHSGFLQKDDLIRIISNS